MSDMSNREKRARVFAGLYNNARPQGMGMLVATPGKISAGVAWDFAEAASSDIDYYQGRVIKCQILEDGTVPRQDLYDRDNGPGACAKAIEDGLTDPYYDFSEYV